MTKLLSLAALFGVAMAMSTTDVCADMVLDWNANAAQAIARWRGSREADQALAQAREFRELLHKAVNVLMRSRTVPQAAIAAVNT